MSEVAEKSNHPAELPLYTALGVLHGQAQGSTIMLAYFYCPNPHELLAHTQAFFGTFLANSLEIRKGFVDIDSLEPTYQQLISPLAQKKIELIGKAASGQLSSRARIPSNFAWYAVCHLNYEE